MNGWGMFDGILLVELTSAEMEASLLAINKAEIEVIGLEKTNELVSCFCIRRCDYGKVQELCRHRGDHLRICKRKGAWWWLRALCRRKLFLCFFGSLLFCVLYLPSRVLFVEVKGNVTIPVNKVLEAAENCGITFGASRREVRSEKIKNELLEQIPELKWAGVNTSGCVATISVQEREKEEKKSDENIVSNIIADKDGYILYGTATKGNAVFQPGQSVKAGQILISGYTDCGICIQATRAEGEVYAQTNTRLDAISPRFFDQKGDRQERKRKISLLFRKKRINLWKDSGISDISCGRIYEEYYILLPGEFRLPFALCVETYEYYEIHKMELEHNRAEMGLCGFVSRYLSEHMIAGAIQDMSYEISVEENTYRLTGECLCVEMIGREQQEKIGDTNGKIS